jgi:AcrR family transcriptional regulator
MMPRLKAPQRREQLMEVATKLFARNGYEATTTAAIALAAGVTEPILYRHFKSKQELFVAIVKAVSDRTMKHWEDLIRGVDDPSEQFRRIAADLPQHMEKLADAYHVLHGALATSRDKKVLAVMKEHYLQIEKFFVKVIQDGQKSGVFRKNMQARAAAWTLIISGIGYGMIALNLAQFDRATADNAIEAILRGWRA